MSLDRLKVELILDDNKFTQRMTKNGKVVNQTREKLDRLNKSVGKNDATSRKWGRTLRDVSVTMAGLHYTILDISRALFSWQFKIIEVNAELERMTTLVKNFSSEQSAAAAQVDAENMVDKLIDKAQRAPFSINALTDSFVKMKTAGLDPLDGQLTALTDAVASFGGTDEVLKRASVAILQMGGKGVISMEELRQQLGEAVPNAARLMARAVGKTYGQFVKEVSEGKISAEPALAAMFREMEITMSGSAERMMDTWNGMMSQLRTQATLLAKEMGDEGYFDAMKDQLRDLIEYLKSPEFGRFARDFGAGMAVVVDMTAQFVKLMVDFGPILLGILGAKGLVGLTNAASRGMSNLYDNTGRFRTSLSRLAAVQKSYAENTERVLNNSRLEANIRSKNAAQLRRYWTEMGQLKSQTSALNKAQLEMINRSVAASQSLAVQERRTKTLRLGMVALRTTLSAMKGVFSLLGTVAVGAAIAMAAEWFITSKRVRETRVELEKTLGVAANIHQLEVAKDRVGELKDRLKDLQEQQESGANKNAYNLRELQKLQERAEKYPSRYKKDNPAVRGLQAEVIAYNSLGVAVKKTSEDLERWNGILEKATGETQAQEMDKLASDLLSSFRRQSQGYVKAASLELDELEKAYRDHGASFAGNGLDAQEGYLARRRDVAVKYAEQQADALRQMAFDFIADSKGLEDNVATGIADIVEKEALRIVDNAKKVGTGLDNLLVSADSKAADKVSGLIAKLRVRLVELENASSSTKGAFEKLVEKFNLVEGSGDYVVIKSLTEQIAKMEKTISVSKAIDGLQQKIEALKSKGNDTGGVFEKLVEKLKLSETDEGYQRLKSLTVELKNLQDEAERSKAFEKINEQVSTLLAKTNDFRDKSDRLFSREATANSIDMSKNLAAVNSTIEDLRAKFVAAGDTTEEFFALANGGFEELRAAAGSADLATAFDQVRKYNVRLSAQLGRQKDDAVSNYDAQIEYVNKTIGAYEGQVDGSEKVVEALKKQKEMLELLREEAAQSPVLKMIQEWRNMSEQIEDITVSALNGFVDQMADMVVEGKASFSDLTKSILKDISKMIIRMTIFNAISAGMNAFGFGNTKSPTPVGTNYGGANFFAKGGIGGVTTKPQINVLGEAGMAEAYVPLPDGRTIPVTMSGQSAKGGGDVEVNVYNQGGGDTNADAQSRFDGERWVVDVVLKAASRPGPMRDVMKGAK